MVLVAGHESRHGGDLWPVSASIPGGVLTTPGRPLHRAVSELLAAGADDVAVLPMTWGRDPVLIADTAQTLRWATTGEGRGRVTLCRPLGATDHLVTLLRKAANDVTETHPDAALVVTGYRSNPFDDAELHRVGHLVRAYGNGSDIEIACVGDESDIERAVLRTRLLGFRSTVLVPADFARTMPAVEVIDKVWFHGPLLPTPGAAAADRHAGGRGPARPGARRRRHRRRTARRSRSRVRPFARRGRTPAPAFSRSGRARPRSRAQP
ncbi:sirohydrochlorin chelatase [Cellulomonas denverensis]|uniref:sirohydrochlorin chelatase n=1 Tax=Cellulomonas denverensis TaxID=264297 RepID=UPI0035ED153F